MKNEVSRLRKERKISQDALASAMGVSRQTICSIENGKYNPSIILAIHIARFFGKTVEDVFVADELTTWKTAESLRADSIDNQNYTENSKLAMPLEPIVGQNHTICDRFRYGYFSLPENGTEAIALYNHAILSEKPRALADILYELEENNMLLVNGYIGTDPKALGRYFLGHRIPYRMFTNAEPFDKHIRRKCGTFIYSYFDTERKTMRTVAGLYDELGITLYNDHDDALKPVPFKTVKTLLAGKELVCAYVFDIDC